MSLLSKLPKEYLEYLEFASELEFEVFDDLGGYIRLEPKDGIEQFNQDIQLLEYAPKFIAFASDGGGEVFVFDEHGAVYLMPLVGMGPNECIKIARSWSDYLKKGSQ